MNELLSKPLSQIVNERQQTASVFEKYNLDYCCKGERSLRDARTEDNICLRQLMEEFQSIYAIQPPGLDFDELKLYQLADYIVYNHHGYVKTEIPVILSQLQKISAEFGHCYRELYKINNLFNDLSKDMTHDMYAEETILFPRIKQLEQYNFSLALSGGKYFEYILLPIIEMEDDHEHERNIMAEIRELTNNYAVPRSAGTYFGSLYENLEKFETNLHQHVHLENNLLFPKALALEKEVMHNALN